MTQETAPQTVAEIYAQDYLPSFRMYRYLEQLAERNEDVRQSDGAWIERIGKLYGVEAVELDTVGEVTR